MIFSRFPTVPLVSHIFSRFPKFQGVSNGSSSTTCNSTAITFALIHRSCADLPAPALVPIPRRIKYERQRRGAGGTPTRRSSPLPNNPSASAEQVFREAYINLKLSNKLHQHGCAWAQCDFDGGDVSSRSHEEHEAAYKEVCVCLLPLASSQINSPLKSISSQINFLGTEWCGTCSLISFVLCTLQNRFALKQNRTKIVVAFSSRDQ